jgi:hypothetical protein
LDVFVTDYLLHSHQSHILTKLRAQSFSIAPLQTRIVPVFLTQTAPFDGTELIFNIRAISENGRTETLSITLPVKHHASASISDGEILKGSFLFASSSPSLFLATPPMFKEEKPLPPVLALRKSVRILRIPLMKAPLDGAGVDILSQDFWMKSLPTNRRSWIISPTGRTSWVSLESINFFCP